MNKRLPGSTTDYLDLVKGPILIVDPSGKIEFVNESLCNMLGYEKKEMIGKNWFQHFIPKQGRKASIREFKKYVAGIGDRRQSESYVQHRDGDLVLVEWQDDPIKNKEGVLVEVLSSGEDITGKYILRHHLKEQRTQNRKELIQAVLQAAEAERREIAYELHDGINQVLTVCKLLAEQEMTKHPSASLEKITDQLQLVINEIRGLSHRLNSSDLGDEGLYKTVKNLVHQVNGTNQLVIKTKWSGIKYLKAVPHSIALNLLRILQEALNNILKHASATVVKIELHASKESIDLEVSDDGRGFEKNEKSKGLGLKTICTRAEVIGGKAYIVSTPNEGTMLSVHVPWDATLVSKDTALFR